MMMTRPLRLRPAGEWVIFTCDRHGCDADEVAHEDRTGSSKNAWLGVAVVHAVAWLAGAGHRRRGRSPRLHQACHLYAHAGPAPDGGQRRAAARSEPPPRGAARRTSRQSRSSRLAVASAGRLAGAASGSCHRLRNVSAQRAAGPRSLGGGRGDAPRQYPKVEQQAFQRFVDGQQLGERAMAEGLAGVAKREHAPLVVGVMGTGHIAHNFGVPHQLKALGISDASVLIPWDDQIGCDDLVPGFADAVFGLDAGAAAASEGGKPRLGVYLEPAPGGGKVVKVVEHSVAEGSGLKEGDYIVELAGSQVPSAM